MTDRIKKYINFNLKVAMILAPVGLLAYLIGTYIEKQTDKKDELRPSYYVYDLTPGAPNPVYYSRNRTYTPLVISYYDTEGVSNRRTMYIGKDIRLIGPDETIKIIDTIKTKTIKFVMINPVTGSRRVGYTHISNIHLQPHGGK
jgi:hypothetical protein